MVVPIQNIKENAKKYSSAPMVEIKYVMVSCVVDASEVEYISTVYIYGESMQAYMYDLLHVTTEWHMANFIVIMNEKL